MWGKATKFKQLKMLAIKRSEVLTVFKLKQSYPQFNVLMIVHILKLCNEVIYEYHFKGTTKSLPSVLLCAFIG